MQDLTEQLGVSVNTVKSHLRGLYQELGASSRREAVANASELGLLASVLPWEESADGADGVNEGSTC